jgi:hypothetical protein
VVTGAAAVDEEPFVDDPDPFVVLLVDEQPDSNKPVTNTVASNHR